MSLPSIPAPTPAQTQRVGSRNDDPTRKLCIKLRRAAEALRETDANTSSLVLDAYNALFLSLSVASQQWILGYFEGIKDKEK